MKVLAVDSDNETLFALNDFFESRGWHFRGFDIPEEAIEYLQKKKVDLILTDTEFSEGIYTGFSFAARAALVSSAPIFLFTSNFVVKDKLRRHKTIDGIIEKPNWQNLQGVLRALK